MTYQLEVYCRRNGVTQDAGTQATGDYPDDQTAIKNLSQKVAELYRYYDEVYWNVYQDERKVK